MTVNKRVACVDVIPNQMGIDRGFSLAVPQEIGESWLARLLIAGFSCPGFMVDHLQYLREYQSISSSTRSVNCHRPRTTVLPFLGRGRRHEHAVLGALVLLLANERAPLSVRSSSTETSGPGTSHPSCLFLAGLCLLGRSNRGLSKTGTK